MIQSTETFLNSMCKTNNVASCLLKTVTQRGCEMCVQKGFFQWNEADALVNIAESLVTISTVVVQTPLNMASNCPICLEVLELTDIDSIHTSRCGHTAHTRCLGTLMRSGMYTCPVCRNSFGEVEIETDRKLQRYSKMLRSGLRPEVVRQRMTVDGIPSATIDSFFTGGASRQVQAEEPVMSVVVDFEKYKKMIRVGLDEVAVGQRMRNDLVEEAAIQKFFDSLYL